MEKNLGLAYCDVLKDNPSPSNRGLLVLGPSHILTNMSHLQQWCDFIEG
jgi:hypothetical protein